MPAGRKKRDRAVQKIVGSNRASTNGTVTNERIESVENSTLELILKKISEFEEKLGQLGSNASLVRSESASGSSYETTEIPNSVNNEIVSGQGLSSLASTSNSVASSETRNIYVVQPSVNKPTFDGRPFNNPITFLKRLKRYLKEINGAGRETDIALIVLQGTRAK